MTKTLLIVAPMTHGLIEYFETAEALGFTPISVHTTDDLSNGPWQALSVHNVPSKLWRGPVFLGSASHSPETSEKRMDRIWHSQFLLAQEVAERAGATDFVNLVHPTAHLSPSVELGQGVFVGPGVTIAHSTTIGDFCLIGRGSTIGHHVELGRYVRLGPGVTIPGSVRLLDRVTVGPGVTFINQIQVGSGAFIGAGSVVTRRVLEGTLVMGNPARRVRNPLTLVRKNVKRARARLLKKLGVYDRLRQMYRRFRP